MGTLRPAHSMEHVLRKTLPIIAFWLVIASGPQSTRAADPQPYTVSIGTTTDAALDTALQEVSLLASLQQTAAVGPFALVARAREDVERFITALRSFGYYRGKVMVEIAGRPLDDPELDGLLDRAPATPPVAVRVTVEPGPLFRLRKIEIQGAVPETLKSALDLPSGAPAQAPEVLAARDRLVQALHEAGYALAKVAQPIAYLSPEEQALDVVYPVETGPLTKLGAVEIKGLKRMEESFVERRLPVRSGQRYDPVALEKARQDFVSLGVFSSVRVRVADQPDAQGHIPVTFEMAERPRRAVSIGAAYSTDLGGSLQAAWQHRNLFGQAEHLNLGIGVTQLGGNSTTGIGYKATAGFTKPDFLRREQALLVNLGAVQQRLLAYDQKAVTGELQVNRRFAQHWSASLGFSGERSHITQAGETRDFTLVGVPMSVKYDDTDSLLDPTEGIRAAATVTPLQPLMGSRTAPFVQMQLAGSTYLDLGASGRSVLALRGVVFATEGAERLDLPPDKRAYAGGSATVRGYKFQSIGPLFPDDKPQGGTAMAAGTVEFRQRFLKDWGAVVFADAGQVSTSGSPFAGGWRFGTGVGARYYTDFGPIRLDVATPLNPGPGSGSFELYIGLGQAF